MGLKMTLGKELNALAYEFKDAYWAITDLSYDTKACYFRLRAYPNREAKLAHLTQVPVSYLPFGCAVSPVVNCVLYNWDAIFEIASVFPTGIPLDENQQKTMVYNFIKAYSKKLNIFFEDVFEEDNVIPEEVVE